MAKNILSFLLVLVSMTSSMAQVSEGYSLFLVGDAGDSVATNQTLKTLQKKLESTPNSAVFFLGDNIYPKGLDGSLEAEQKLLSQLNILKKYKGDWYFVPGNHDWAKGRWKGYKNIIRQANYINQFAKDSLQNSQKHFFPEQGFPGPFVIENSNHVLIFTDTDWWLHRPFFHKVGKNTSFSDMEDSYYQRLDSALVLSQQKNKTPIFLTHHPLVNYGEHGEKTGRQPLRFLVNYTPLQILGLLGLNRALLSEMRQPRYMKMKDKMLASLNKYKNVIAVSGHEHNLQAIKKDSHLYLISGAGSKLTHYKHPITEKDALFAKDVSGFMELQLLPNQEKILKVWGENGELLFSYSVSDSR